MIVKIALEGLKAIVQPVAEKAVQMGAHAAGAAAQHWLDTINPVLTSLPT